MTKEAVCADIQEHRQERITMPSPHVVELTSENWETEVGQSTQPVLVDFWSPTCGPCRMQSPIIDRVADQFVGQAKVGKVNVDDSPALAERYRIDAIPQLFLFKGGPKPVDQALGLTPENELVRMIQRALGA